MGIRVLSLFDGMACGLQALKQAGIAVDAYHAFEIDKYAIAVAQKNHPEIIQHGSVVGADFAQFKDFDLLIGGSPCQGFSFAGKGLAFNDPRSALFFEFIRAGNEARPKHFLLENVKMKKEHLAVITNYVGGVSPVLINSALVSAQNRQRYYWCSWSVGQPVDRGILLKDVVEDGAVARDKSLCIDANYYKGGSTNNYWNKVRTGVPLAQSEQRLLVFGAAQRGRYTSDGRIAQQLEYSGSQKSNALTGVQKDSLLAEASFVRKLTVTECERLQTLPDGYTEGVSDTQRYKMLGNGWTVAVIEHLFRSSPYAAA